MPNLTKLIPGLVIRLLPEKNSLTGFHKLLIFFVFFILQGTRIANWVGQTTLLVFFFMLTALLVTRKNEFLAGILLGIALSKYSLAISVFLFLLLKREYLILIISLVVQVLGAAIVSLCITARQLCPTFDNRVLFEDDWTSYLSAGHSFSQSVSSK